MDKSLENFIDFCDEMQISEEGAQIDAFKITRSQAYKDAKRSYRAACKLIKSDPEEAIEEFKDCIKAIDELKEECNAIKDESSKICKFFAHLNPLLALINNEETTGMIYTGNGWIRTYTVYSDSMSKKAPNQVAREVQEALNLMKKRCNDGISRAQQKLRKMNK